MSFIEELKNELQQENLNPAVSSNPHFDEERFRIFIQKELSSLRDEIKEAARSGKFEKNGEKTIFKGTRLWHDDSYNHKDAMLEKEILEQRKKLFYGYYYEVRFSLLPKGISYFEQFQAAFAREGIAVTGPFVMEKQAEPALLPYTFSGSVKYDFELEHHLNDYPQLYYSYQLEI